MRIALGADHRGSETIKAIAAKLRREGHEVTLTGSLEGEPCDYPEPAYRVATAVARGEADMGVLVCGTGIGVSIAANKVKGIRAATVHDELTAGLSRSHNDANLLCLSGDLLGIRLIEKILDVWLSTRFEGGRHLRRVRKIQAIERGEDPSLVPE